MPVISLFRSHYVCDYLHVLICNKQCAFLVLLVRIFSCLSMDSPAFPLKGPSSHAKTVPYSCASLMQAKALREAEIRIVDMLAKTVEGSTPASEDIQNSLKCTTSKPLPHIQGTEIHSTAAHSVPIQTLRDDFLLSVGKSILVTC